MKKKGIIAASVLIFVLLCAYFGLSAYVASSLTKVERIPVTENPGSFGISYQDVSFTSRVDNFVLKGWNLEGEIGQPTIIMVHGREGNRANGVPGTMDLANSLVEEGFNVFMFDLRGHGDSEGTYLSAGYYEKYDLLGAVDYVKSRGAGEIGVIGFSMGAATSILAAAEEPAISAIVSDSSWADLTEIANREVRKMIHLPDWFEPGYLLALRVMHGIDLKSAKPIDVVGTIAPRPIFFIHGQADSFIPPSHANRLYEASNSPSNDVWLVPDAGHVKSYQTAPAEYEERIMTFFEREL
jgi:pimeloyl-ACP methyl ester carboxylesterase